MRTLFFFFFCKSPELSECTVILKTHFSSALRHSLPKSKIWKAHLTLITADQLISQKFSQIFFLPIFSKWLIPLEWPLTVGVPSPLCTSPSPLHMPLLVQPRTTSDRFLALSWLSWEALSQWLTWDLCLMSIPLPSVIYTNLPPTLHLLLPPSTNHLDITFAFTHLSLFTHIFSSWFLWLE